MRWPTLKVAVRVLYWAMKATATIGWNVDWPLATASEMAYARTACVFCDVAALVPQCKMDDRSRDKRAVIGA